MAYDLEEQEQIDAIKAWWNDYGKLVMIVAIALLLAIAAFQGWRYYRGQQAERAAILYSQMNEADRAGDAKRIRDIAGQIIERYGSSQYAGMAALAAAKAGVATGEMEDAKKKLQWATDNAKEAEMRDVARLRLAALLLDEKKFDEALKLLAVKPADAFAMLYADLRGDVLSAQGKPAEARTAYQEALGKGDPKGNYSRLVEVKLDALGEGK